MQAVSTLRLYKLSKRLKSSFLFLLLQCQVFCHGTSFAVKIYDGICTPRRYKDCDTWVCYCTIDSRETEQKKEICQLIKEDNSGRTRTTVIFEAFRIQGNDVRSFFISAYILTIVELKRDIARRAVFRWGKWCTIEWKKDDAGDRQDSITVNGERNSTN